MSENLSLLKSPHAGAAEEVIRTLGTDASAGLTSSAATERLARFGRNELAQAPREPWWRRLARQFADLLIWILIAAAIISGALGEWLDAVAILAIVVLNGVLGFVQEGRAEQALAALRKLSSPHAKVIRDGRSQNLPAAELVPGDRIDLEPGDRVPADVRLIGTAGFRVEEAALTGESVPSDKDHRAILSAEAPLGDRVNLAYMGTTVVAGTASAVVVATGMNTEIGHIAGMLQQEEIEQTPLQRRLSELGRMLVYVVLGIVALMFLLQVWRGGKLVDAFLLSVSLAVAAVPEGLSAVVTVALALGLQRMAKRHALIRRLPSVETLGAVTVICTDKTGTLTRNEMTVREIEAGGKRYEVTGGGYEPVGEFRARGPSPAADAREAQQANTDTVDPRQAPALRQALTVGAWCGHAQVTRANEHDGKWELIGDPTEGALVVAAMKAGVQVKDRDRHIVHEIPFSSDRKAMSVVVRIDENRLFMYTKGAPEVVLDKCTRALFDGEERPLNDDRRHEILQVAHAMGERALRVLGLAYREVETPQSDETNLIFAGLAGMMDPPREEARAAVERCLSAGIRPVMITGDHPDTAKAIARDLRIMREGQRVLLGIELDQTDDAKLAAEVEQIPVYARVTAAHKLRIIKAWRARHQVVAMTGDGVNDAPAIKAADVGVAMGVTGTDVTKEASDMVLTDDNFASIVNAVEEGRTIYDNIRKFVHYLLATNAGEVMFMFCATLIGWPAPLVAIQLLWINLVTDALPAMALGVEPPEPDVMQRPPRPPNERVITIRRGLRILYHGALNAVVAGVAFYVVYRGREENLPAARTAAFCTLAFAQLLFSFGCRSERYTLPQLGLFSNRWLLGAIAVSALLQLAVVTSPFLQPLFKVAPGVFAREWLLIVALALTPVTLVEVAKLVRERLRSRGADL
ncbi:MAG: P-type Ca2+ transporter type [Phycisphaerales bacterium]|nr:P-type Ca2+ transporter type [Phycisphaerales bacterium]